MHTEISYANRPDAQRKAINDWCNYLGLKRAKLLLCLARQDKPIRELWDSFNRWCGFTGVTGYPVLATFAYCHAMTVEELQNHPALADCD